MEKYFIVYYVSIFIMTVCGIVTSILRVKNDNKTFRSTRKTSIVLLSLWIFSAGVGIAGFISRLTAY